MASTSTHHHHQQIVKWCRNTLLKDVIIGILLGMIMVFTTNFLDYHGIVHFQSAHHVRTAALRVFNHPETITNIEESSHLKFMNYAEYESIRMEIDVVDEELAFRAEEIDKRTLEDRTKRTEIEAIQKEHDRLIQLANEYWGLDRYCPECRWGGSVSCETRVSYLKRTYGVGTMEATVSALQKESCKRAAVR